MSIQYILVLTLSCDMFFFFICVCFLQNGEIRFLVSVQREDLRRVMELLSVREHHARTLLIHYRWDVEKLIALYVEKGKSCIFSEAGVSVAEFIDLDPQDVTSTVFCNICIDDVPATDLTLMNCGHCFCNNCKCPFLLFGFCSRLT